MINFIKNLMIGIMDWFANIPFYLIYFVILSVSHLAVYNAGMIKEEERILNLQVPSAHALSDNIMNGCKKEVSKARAELDSFRFEVCSQLGLIKE